MLESKFYSRRAFILMSFVVLGFLTATGWLPLCLSAQASSDVVFEFRSVKPVEIASVMLYDQKIAPSNVYKGKEPWLKGLRIDIINRSNKAIRAVALRVVLFDKTESDPYDSPLSFILNFGDSRKALRGQDSDINIARDSPFTLSVNPSQAASMAQWLNSHGSARHHIVIFPEQMVYEDGSVWWSGKWYRSSPYDPDDLIPDSKNSSPK